MSWFTNDKTDAGATVVVYSPTQGTHTGYVSPTSGGGIYIPAVNTTVFPTGSN